MADFPTSSMISAGLVWSRYRVVPKAYGDVTDSYEFEDGGMTFNERTTTPPQRWEIEYTGLSIASAALLDTFWNTYRKALTFTFLDKAGSTQTGVRIESYERNHDAHKSWINTVTLTLVKYP